MALLKGLSGGASDTLNIGPSSVCGNFDAGFRGINGNANTNFHIGSLTNIAIELGNVQSRASGSLNVRSGTLMPTLMLVISKLAGTLAVPFNDKSNKC